jgi:polygalacturonase
MRKAIFALLVFLQPALSYAEYDIPNARRINWTGAGVRDGIPARPALTRNAITDDGANGDDINDDTSHIQSCLNNAYNPSYGYGVCYLPAGTYRITSQLSIPSNVTLRGAGTDRTTIKQYTNSAKIIIMGIDYNIIGHTNGPPATWTTIL